MGESQLDLLERLLVRLDQYASSVTRRDLELDLDTWLKVSRALELVAQCVLDLAMEMVAKRGLGVPETYRNVLAHLYTTIDLDRLHAAMTEDKSAIIAFARLAAEELAEPPS